MNVDKVGLFEKSKTLNKQLFEKSISGTIIINSEGKILFCSENIVSLLGFESPIEILKTKIDKYLFDLQGNHFQISQLSDDFHNKKATFKLKISHEKHQTCQCSINKLDNENDNLFVFSFSDIKPDKLTENQKDKGLIAQLIKRLELSETRFKRLSELSSSPICIHTQEKFLFVNPAWERLTGYSQGEAALMNCTSIIHSDFAKLIKNRFKAKLEGKKVPEKFAMKMLSKSGNEIWVNTDLSLVDYEGEQAILTVLADITEMKRTQQALKSSKKKFQSLFYENNSIMIVVDPQNGDIVDANEAACMFYGYSKAKIITLNIKDITISTPEEIEAEITAAMSGKRSHSFYKHRLSGKEIRDVELYSGSVEMKEGVYLYSIVHDITARKEAEEALKKSERELKNLNAQKDRFFSIIAHDLRGPLGTFMQLTEFMKENYSSLDDADFEKYFNHLYSSAEGTFKLLENLLVWTRSQLGAIVLKPEVINIQKLSNETIKILEESARAKNIGIFNQVPQSLTVFADKNTIATVIRNLINNAIKFTNEDGQIKIMAKRSKKEKLEGKSFIEISIKDSGVGIEKENISKLFQIEESYTSVGTNDERGTGLGLILCKELVDKNGGEIWVKSKLNEGSIFTFCLEEPDNSLN